MKKYTILGLLDDGGSKMQRVKIALQELQGKIIKIEGEEREIDVKYETFPRGKIILKREMLEGIDLVWNNWLVSIDCVEISLWQSQMGFKFLTDIDDAYWDETHPFFKWEWKVLVPRICVFSDFVTCTNPYLAEKLYPFNNNTAIIPNFLPVGNGQYVGKPEDKKFKEGKLRVGVFGSSSHIDDYKLLKSVINRLAKNKEIVEKCEFNLLGVGKTSQISKEFAKKKNLKVNYFSSIGVEEYMYLLDNQDVILQPLVDSDYNRAKSALKIIETTIKEGVLVGSKLYAEKEFPSYFIAETPYEYEQTILELLKEGKYVEYRDKFVKENLELNKWKERIDFTLELVDKIGNLEKRELQKGLKLVGITYDGNQITEHERYDNSHIKTIEDKSYLFEWNPIIKTVDELDENTDYLGIFSWKFPYKTHLYSKLLHITLDNAKYTEFDIIGLCPPLREPYLSFTERMHPRFMELFTPLCEDLGLEVKEPKHIVYSNFYIAKSSVYKEFVNTIIKPAIELMEGKYRDLAWKEVKYLSGLKKEKLKELTGLDFYTAHTFQLERLMSVWLENRPDLKFKQLR